MKTFKALSKTFSTVAFDVELTPTTSMWVEGLSDIWKICIVNKFYIKINDVDVLCGELTLQNQILKSKI